MGLGEHTSDGTVEGERCGGDVAFSVRDHLALGIKINLGKKGGRLSSCFFSIFILYWSAVDLQRK